MISEAAAAAIAAIAVSVVSAGIAGWSIRYARRSDRSAARSAAAAEQAAAAAAKTAALDAERRHAELTPVFEITCTGGENGIGDQGELRVDSPGPTPWTGSTR